MRSGTAPAIRAACAGEQIPLAARIFAVVDVADALLSDRPYRPAWSPARVRAHIASLSGTHFDPAVVTSFLGLKRDEGSITFM
jgi:HD-GYP domain-containing protein (c-di-GMP phosphodiesterase class II)